MWPDVRKEIGDAQLHIYYGWDTYDSFIKQGFMKENGFKAKMLDLMNQPGVIDHGRVGHKELLQEYAKASILAYPCTYAGEINCIALTKAIACGCVAVTNDKYVMGERNPHVVVKDEGFQKALIDTLKNPPMVHDTKYYIAENSWRVVARAWARNLFKFDAPVVLSERLNWIRSNVDKSLRIIDIGCNKGHLFTGWDRSNIHSVDIDKYDLPNFTQADATKPLPFKDKEFDIAVLAEITEHTDDPVSVMREAMRISKKLIITVPWEHKWTSELNPFHGVDKIEEKIKQEHVNNRLELARMANPEVKEFYSADNYEHLYHKQFYTPELMKEHLSKADIVDYKLYEIRHDNWAWIGVICGC
jgi:ubiquinone/menaquinone biosynthesis C-methylase UbiE